MNKLGIIIPAHNEEKRIGRTLSEYYRYFSELKKQKILDFEIIIVLNGCRDRTIDVVNSLAKKYKEITYLEFEQSGKGFAIIEGFKNAIEKEIEFIGFVDADMATSPEAFYDLFKNIGKLDGIIANRWDKRSKIYIKQTFVRRILSRGYNFLVRSLFFFPHRDTQCGAKLFKKELLEKVVHKLGSSEWSFDVDLLFYARREHATIKSTPTIWEDKRESKLNIKKTPLTMFLSSVRLRLIHSPFRFMVRLYRKFPDWMKL